jgi:hypothetical protein
MPLPRGLFSLSLLWALASFVAAVGAGAPIQPTAGAYAPGVRAYLALLALGIVAAWPVARLTLDRRRWPADRAVLDTCVVAVLLQGAFWPLHLVTSWSLGRDVAIDLLLSGWAVAAGAVVALGRGTPRRGTPLALAAVAVAGAGPIVDILDGPPGLACALGPLAGLARLTTAWHGPDPVEWQVASWPWIVAACLWSTVVLLGRRGPHACPDARVRLP